MKNKTDEELSALIDQNLVFNQEELIAINNKRLAICEKMQRLASRKDSIKKELVDIEVGLRYLDNVYTSNAAIFTVALKELEEKQ